MYKMTVRLPTDIPKKQIIDLYRYQYYCSPISSFLYSLVHVGESCGKNVTYHSSGVLSINFFIKALHFSSSSTTTSIPRCFKYSSPPTKVLFSAITTRATLYRMQAPVHMSQGESEVYIVAPSYAFAGSRPEFSRADISAYGCQAVMPRTASLIA